MKCRENIWNLLLSEKGVRLQVLENKDMYYHIWFVTKYRKVVLLGEVEKFVKDVLTECIQRHNYKVLELETNKDHAHMLVEAPDKKELSAIVRTLKAVSAKELLGTSYFRMGNTRHLWARRYGWREVAETEIESMRKYIRNQKNIPHTCNPMLPHGECLSRKIPHAEACGHLTSKRPSVYLRTFGCQMNVRDSEIIYGLLIERGWKRAESMEDADCVLFNTCSVRHHAEQRAYSNMGMLAKLKKHKPDLILGFIGCTAQKDKDIVFKRLPHVNLVAGPGEIYNIPDYLDAILRGEKRISAIDTPERPEKKNPLYREGKISAYVSISEGCNNYCSYCIVPYVRGREKSRRKELIIDEVCSLTKMGIKEVTLLGQNVNSYGKDLKNGLDFISLLKEVHTAEGVKRIRFVTCHPKDTTVELFEMMRDLPKIYNHLHLPLQSGSAKILKAMKRGYSPEHYLKLIDTLRGYISDCNITTDIIVGFPGEKDKDFEDTYNIMKEIEFDSAYIFKYSPRPPAESTRLPDDVPLEVKKRRHAELLELQKEISRKKRASRKTEVLPMA